MSDATDNRFYREKQPAASVSLLDKMEIKHVLGCLDVIKETVESVERAIAAMGGVRLNHQSSGGAVVQNSDNVPPPAHTSDIPSNAHQEVLKIFHEMFPWFTNEGSGTKSKDFVDAIRPYLATREPVAVSLEKCAKALTMRGYFMSDIEKANLMSDAKAVLDAAGVDYVG